MWSVGNVCALCACVRVSVYLCEGVQLLEPAVAFLEAAEAAGC